MLSIVIVIKGIKMAYNVGNPMFKGSLVALITPFANGVIDEAAFRKLVCWQIEEGPMANSCRYHG